MAEYVDRHNALMAFCTWCSVCAEDRRKPEQCDDIMAGILKRLPPADVEERKYGKWEFEPNIGEYQCSICGRTTTDRHDEPVNDEFGKGIALCLPRYCGFCGAYMRKRESDREEKRHENAKVTLPQAD